ncbi:unnamed protein product [Microthlaspi erraticum]|uniref:Uncharacterized protein n=1 Tax=Microthlaspi erraticum TaxID=1685480 RepID=A0A6D2J336_9BRAS|nr:unnamed protein product [Microthlaspi erraticum]
MSTSLGCITRSQRHADLIYTLIFVLSSGEVSGVLSSFRLLGKGLPRGGVVPIRSTGVRLGLLEPSRTDLRRQRFRYAASSSDLRLLVQLILHV